jgi:hypothetical protein
LGYEHTPKDGEIDEPNNNQADLLNSLEILEIEGAATTKL